MNPLKVHYLGDDPDFIKNIQEFIQQKKLLVTLSHSLEEPLSICLDISPLIIFLDFTSFTCWDLYIRQTCFIKRTTRFKPVLFVGLFKDEEELKKNDFIFASGIQFSFIKGGENQSLFRDSLYIAFDEKISYPNYAVAKGLLQTITAGICSAVTEIHPGGMTIETDLELGQSQLSIVQKLFPDLVKIEAINDPEIALRYPMLSSIESLFPVADPWEDDTESSILPETVETWIDLHKEHLVDKRDSVFIVDSTFSIFKDAFKIDNESQLHTLYFETLADTRGFLEKVRPPLIFIDINEQDEEPNSLLQAEKLLELIRNQESYLPILILSNMATSSSALQKFFNYNFVICLPDRLVGGMIEKFSDLYLKKKLNKSKSFTYTLSPSSNLRTLDVNFEITVIRLTEHEIIFKSDVPLPMFTVLHFIHPVEFYATLVPHFLDNAESRDERIRIGLIHGVSEKKLELLRQFVNLLIVKPTLDFKTDIKTHLIPVKEEKKDETKSEKKEDVFLELEIPKKVDKVMNEIPKRKVRFQGKSKL